MRYSLPIALLLATLPVDAEVRFGEPHEFPDLALEFPVPANAAAEPLAMPRAEAYLVSGEKEGQRLEDRYDIFDLWTLQTERARWRDDAGNRFTIFRIPFRIPDASPGTTLSRTSFRERMEKQPLKAEDVSSLDAVLAAALPMDVQEAVRPRRARRQNLEELREYPAEDGRSLVYAFRPRRPDRTSRNRPGWYVAALLPAESEDLDAAREAFDAFLDNVRMLPGAPAQILPKANEMELLRDDVRRSVVNCPEWNFTAADDVTIVDNLDATSRAAFVPSLTNELPRLRRLYAEVAPSPLADTFHPAVVRVFRNRLEYLEYVGADHKWTAALWSPARRELVLYLPEEGTEKLLRTVRHEAFHQHVAYAGAMIQTAPWFNEGNAELFERTHFDSDENIAFDAPAEDSVFIKNNLDALAEYLPALFALDYWPREGEAEGFYSGPHEALEMKYRLAWSVAYFLQVGAPDVRFRPFENLRRDYMRALVRTRSGASATTDALGGETMRDLIAEWRTFWKRQQ